MNPTMRRSEVAFCLFGIACMSCTYAFSSNGECRASANHCSNNPKNSSCHCCKNEWFTTSWSNTMHLCTPCSYGRIIDALGHRISTCQQNSCRASTNYCNKGSTAFMNANCHCCSNEYLFTWNGVQESSPCMNCVSMYYQVPDNHRLSFCSSASPSQACVHSQSETCMRCPQGFTRANYSSYYQCRKCASRGVIWNEDPDWSCVPWCRKGEYLEFDGVYIADCLICPAGTYQDQDNHRLTTCKKCPQHSNSPAGSDLTDCKCNDGFSQEYIFANGAPIDFNCYCDPGYYVSGGACIKCSTCNKGMYRLNCGTNSAGTCEKCKDCVNPSQLRAGCGYLSEGECKDRTELVRTPFCPVALEGSGNTELAISVRQASGLGAFSFEQVFGTDELEADFVCSKPCDGVSYDSIQCDGPFACNVKTCAEMSRTNELPRACPVVIENTDLDVSAKSVRDRKRRETCVECTQCGPANDFFVDRESKAH